MRFYFIKAPTLFLSSQVLNGQIGFMLYEASSLPRVKKPQGQLKSQILG